MTPRLVATDFDGTLVRSDFTVSHRTNKVFKELSGMGVTIVGVTGRGPRLRRLCHRDLPSADFLVLAQGGFVYRVTGEETAEALHETFIHGDHVVQAVELVERETGPVKVIVENDPTHESHLVGDLVDDWPWPVPIRQAPRAEALRGQVVKSFLRSDTIPAPQLLRLARKLIPAQLASLTDAGVGNVEICPPGIDKATGLALVAELVDVDPADVVVFGDAENDLPMFAWAGRSVAVANAHEHVKTAATDLTSSNDEDGVAMYLEKLFGL